MNAGTRLWISISDPFELSQEMEARIEATHSFIDGAETERILVRLSKELSWRDRGYRMMVVEPRFSPGILEELRLQQTIEFNGYGTDESAEDAAPWGFSDWRGGLAVIGTVSVLRSAVPPAR